MIMNTEQIQNRIEEILNDERLSYSTASVYVNAPLALIQYGLQVELHTLQKVLSIPLTDIKKLRGE